jgi:vacuolar-type H+-ATPase subunit C/Vma6
MLVWLKDLSIFLGVFIVMGLLSLLVFVAYYYYENWWDSRHATAEQKDSKSQKSIGYICGYRIVKMVAKIFKKDKGEESKKNSTPHQGSLYHKN